MDLKTIPQLWNESITCLIPKEAGTSDPLNQRPIALVSCFYKIYSHIINNRLNHLLETNQILSEAQHGFRQNRSTSQCIHTYQTIIQYSRLHKLPLHALYVDFNKAFDSVEHWLIETVLQYINVPPDFAEIILSLLLNNKTRLLTAYGLTDKIPLTSGVRQGDIISPTLFLLSILPFLNKIEHSNLGFSIKNLKIPYLAYADDIVTLISSFLDLSHLFNILVDFCENFNLTLNCKPQKTAHAWAFTYNPLPLNIKTN